MKAQRCVRSALLGGFQVLAASRKQPILPLNARVVVDAFEHPAGEDLGEFFGFNLVKSSAVDAAFRNQSIRWCGLAR